MKDGTTHLAYEPEHAGLPLPCGAEGSRRRRPEERIAEPQHTAFLRWRGDTEARNAVYANRNRLHSAVGKQSMSATAGDRRAIVRS